MGEGWCVLMGLPFTGVQGGPYGGKRETGTERALAGAAGTGGGDFQDQPLGLSVSVCKVTPVVFRSLWISLHTPGAQGALASREWRVEWDGGERGLAHGGLQPPGETARGAWSCNSGR